MNVTPQDNDGVDPNDGLPIRKFHKLDGGPIRKFHKLDGLPS